MTVASLLRLARRLALALLLSLAGLATPAAAMHDDEAEQIVDATRIDSEGDEPPAKLRGEAVRLPFRWSNEPGSQWFRLRWWVPERTGHTFAVYLTATTVPVRVFVNGTLVGSTGDLAGPPPRSWNQAQAFDVPSRLLVAGENRIDLQAQTPPDGHGSLDAVLAGQEPAIRNVAFRDLMLHTIVPAMISVATLMVGFFILTLWSRHRERAYGMFGLAALLWGVHTAVTILPEPLLPQPHFSIWWHAVYMTFAIMLSLFCAEFAGVTSRRFRRIALGYAFAVAPVLYLAWAFDVYNPVAIAVRAGGILIVVVALGWVVRFAVRARTVESAMFLLTGAVSAGLGIHDWLLDQSGAIRPLWLVPYAALLFLTLIGWLLVDRFVKARRESEKLNEILEQRVAEKSAALEGQLAGTEEARCLALAAQERAEAADQAKSRFLAAASHDLRQPLHALGLFCAALSERAHDAENRALVGRINTTVESLDALLSALLDISRLDAGVVVAEHRDFPLGPLFDRLANDFSPEALDASLRLSILPTRAFVHTDPVLLERILRNLVGNALKYTERGGVVLGARRRGDGFSIEVWDTGCGIPTTEQERVFEEFYQIGNPERDRSRGLGLGLAIVRRLTDLLGHPLWLRSRPGRGTVIAVRVPAGDTEALAPALLERAPWGNALAGKRVLVIDDDPGVRDGMAQALVAWGCVPVAVAGPEDLPAGAEVPDVMIVDFRLRGGIDGLAAIEALRRRFGHAVPAIVVSGESMPAELARIKDAGYVLLHKPVGPARMRAAVSFLVLRQSPATPSDLAA